MCKLLISDGGQGRNRTTDTRIFSPLLYQLSYLAAVRSRGENPGGRRIKSVAGREVKLMTHRSAVPASAPENRPGPYPEGSLG